ncbi:ADP-ribosylation factor-like protein 15 [Octopus bimaculoides]|uniref:ADP-ribosylation factor-like protein 15 n=1 Tax=Octopus bimaculoides TaxID=37653 RepID=UPI0022E3BDE6|nr:ADP-ribosylation factor-like protein 15 [Octopus bimaculoides]
MCANFGLYCALIRLGLYSFGRRVCCTCRSPPEKPVFQVLCLGLTGSGKSAIIYALSNDSVDKLEPTVGFLIKPLEFTDCIFEMKELGGADNVRIYWDRYLSGVDALIYVVNSADTADDLQLASQELTRILQNKQLNNVPLLLMANHHDMEDARSMDQLKQIFDWPIISTNRQCIIHPCSIKNTDTIEQGFKKLCGKLQINASSPGK